MALRVVAVLLLTTIYAVLRYVICGNVPLQNTPVYVLNKSVSWSSVVFLLLAARSSLKGGGANEVSRCWGRAMLHCAFVHVLLSLTILGSGYFGKFFADERMTWRGELSMLFGVLAAYLFVVLMRPQSGVPGHRRLLQMMASLGILMHLAFMGVPGWWQVDHWLGGMPPISLLSAVCVGVALVLYGRGQG